MDSSTQKLKDMIQRMTELDAPSEEQRKQLDEMASMNVSMSAETADEVASMMRLMQNAGMGDAGPVAQDTPPMRQDMERLAGIMGDPEPEGPGEVVGDMPMSLPGKDGSDPEQAGMASDDDMEADDDSESDDDEEDTDEAYDNAPEEDYQDTEYMTKDISGGLNRQKKQYAKAQDGDNAMAVESIKDRLYAELSEKKAKPDFADIDDDGDKKEPMKKAAKDKKSKKD